MKFNLMVFYISKNSDNIKVECFFTTAVSLMAKTLRKTPNKQD